MDWKSKCCSAPVKIPRYKLPADNKDPLGDKKEYVCCKCNLGCDINPDQGQHDFGEAMTFQEKKLELFEKQFAGSGGYCNPYYSQLIKDFISQALQDQAEEIISYIGHNEGWEESEDLYREHFGLKTKYK